MNLDGETQTANEEAVRAMSDSDEVKEQGHDLVEPAAILKADPGNDLSVSRLIAERMQPRGELSGVYSESGVDEPVATVVSPEVARQWLIDTKRAAETDNGLIWQDKKDHLGLAALAISKGSEPQVFAKAYNLATDNRGPLHPDIVEEIAQRIVSHYSEQQAD